MSPEKAGQIEVVAGMIRRGDEFLAARRPDDAAFGGFWELPGGKLEAGESGNRALARELWEELGITVRNSRFLATGRHFYPEQKLHVTLHFYEVTEFEGEPRAREGQTLRWLALSGIGQVEFLEADREFLAEFVQGGLGG